MGYHNDSPFFIDAYTAGRYLYRKQTPYDILGAKFFALVVEKFPITLPLSESWR